MANPEHLAILKQGVEVWNRWRRENRGVVPDLSEANLEDHILEGANLQHGNLKRVNLRGANLSQANLDWTNLIHACLSESLLTNAIFREAYLLDTDLHRADLSGADFRKAHLSEVNLSGAVLKNTDFTESLVSRLLLCEVDLSQAKGLASMHHAKRSSVDLATLQLSKGTLPDQFLRGVGLTDQFISYWHTPSADAVEFHSTFISYSTRDQAFAARLHADLQSKGVRCWFAPHDIQGGKKIHEQIDEAIRLYDRLLLILSEDSMSSDWVKTEIAHARQREIGEKRQMLFPISIVPFEEIKEWKAFDADTGKDSAREIREYFIPDFSNWKDHDSYQAAFQRLLRDLKAEGGSKPL